MAEDAKQEVIETNPEAGAQEDLADILSALEKDDTVVVDPNADPASSKDGEEKPFKKVGNLVFKTEADYDAWAIKNNGEVSRLTGELKKATDASKANPTTETKNDVTAIRMQIKVADFFEANPDAVEYRDIISSLIRSGKAKTLEDAKNMAFKAVGVEPKKEEDNGDNVKNLLKAGGNDSGVGAGSYNSNADVKGTSDFADSALLGQV